MGITGLIPFLKNASRPVNIRNFSEFTVAVDAYCWLHKGAFSCADRLAKGEKTDGYVFYCVKQINSLRAAGIRRIVMVFDGQRLPLKTVTENKRHENRRKYKLKGKEYLIEGKLREANECFLRCVEITSEMAIDVIKACRKLGVDCIVAPYEADAQLAYLNKIGVAQLIITEDSDLVLFGCDMILFKLDINGNGLLVEKDKLPLCFGTKSESFSFDKFRKMCIMSGCDYLPSLPGIGLGKAFKFFASVTNPNLDIILSKIPVYLNMPSLTVSVDYKESFVKAYNTFLYQLVFDPLQRKLVPLNPYPEHLDYKTLNYAGPYISDETAYQIALGNISLETMKRVDNFDPNKYKVAQVKSSGWNLNPTPTLSIWDGQYTIQSRPKKVSTPEKVEVALKIPHLFSKSAAKLKRSYSDVLPETELTANSLMSLYGTGNKKLKKHDLGDSSMKVSRYFQTETNGLSDEKVILNVDAFPLETRVTSNSSSLKPCELKSSGLIHLFEELESPKMEKGSLLFDKAISGKRSISPCYSHSPLKSPVHSAPGSSSRDSVLEQWNRHRPTFAYQSDNHLSSSPLNHTQFKPVKVVSSISYKELDTSLFPNQPKSLSKSNETLDDLLIDFVDEKDDSDYSAFSSPRNSLEADSSGSSVDIVLEKTGINSDKVFPKCQKILDKIQKKVLSPIQFNDNGDKFIGKSKQISKCRSVGLSKKISSRNVLGCKRTSLSAINLKESLARYGFTKTTNSFKMSSL